MYENAAGRGVSRTLASLALVFPAAANDESTRAWDLSRKCAGRQKAALRGDRLGCDRLEYEIMCGGGDSHTLSLCPTRKPYR